MLTALGTSFPGPSRAQSSNLSGTVALSSQLVDRGLAISPVTPIVQGAVSWASSSGWALGLSAATQTRSPGNDSEALAQVAHYWSLSDDWRMQAGLVYYTYPDNARAHAFERVETGVSWLYRDVLTFGLSAITLTQGHDHQPRGAADVDFHWPLPQHLALSAGLGVSQTLVGGAYGYPGAYEGQLYPYHLARVRSYYGYGHFGLVWAYEAWRVELDRMVTDPDIRRSGVAAAPWVATLSWSF
ncbi:TorF family putative porin [Dyella monticola]|uniref:TorF family putative porin n=1 Tax=Dyella monticola TaxID=1927958 RepID=UPI001E62656B|nr:TorF family putative porin [Dyella monticola]